MGRKKFTELPAADALTGVEIVAVVQDGVSKQTTAQDIADLAPGGGGGGVDSVAPSTAGGTITLNFQTSVDRIFVGDASFATPKTIALSNDAGALRLSFVFQITNVAAVLTFPASFKMTEDGVRWNASTNEWTPDGIGLFEAYAIFDGASWLMRISPSAYT